jgi:hypothetical protein
LKSKLLLLLLDEAVQCSASPGLYLSGWLGVLSLLGVKK